MGAPHLSVDICPPEVNAWNPSASGGPWDDDVLGQRGLAGDRASADKPAGLELETRRHMKRHKPMVGAITRMGIASRWACAAAPALCSLMLAFGALQPAHSQNKAAAANEEIAQLRERVTQLEAQLVDMRVILGTLQSLAKAPGAGASYSGPPARGGGSGGGGGDAGRIGILETQIRALTAQLERLADQVRALNGGGRRGSLEPRNQQVPAFGSTTVTPRDAGRGDQIGSIIRRSQSPSSTAGTVERPPVAPAPETSADTGARARYEEAYGYWLQGNLRAARMSFAQFLQDHGDHELAGNAQYWLGEVHFREGRYNRAAKAFLKVSQEYTKSRMAPDSLLRLAQSLGELGHDQAACSTLSELHQRYPTAPRGVLRKAKTEARRMGCAG